MENCFLVFEFDMRRKKKIKTRTFDLFQRVFSESPGELI